MADSSSSTGDALQQPPLPSYQKQAPAHNWNDPPPIIRAALPPNSQHAAPTTTLERSGGGSLTGHSSLVDHHHQRATTNHAAPHLSPAAAAFGLHQSASVPALCSMDNAAAFGVPSVPPPPQIGAFTDAGMSTVDGVGVASSSQFEPVQILKAYWYRQSSLQAPTIGSSSDEMRQRWVPFSEKDNRRLEEHYEAWSSSALSLASKSPDATPTRTSGGGSHQSTCPVMGGR